jgi:hypothetical protein
MIVLEIAVRVKDHYLKEQCYVFKEGDHNIKFSNGLINRIDKLITKYNQYEQTRVTPETINMEKIRNKLLQSDQAKDYY